MILLISVLVVSLGISFICSLMEAVLLSLTPVQIARMSTQDKNLAKIWQKFKGRIERPIAVILLLNTAAHTIGASVSGAQFDNLFGSQWILVFSLGMTYFMLQFTEILPKTIGVRFNVPLAKIIAKPLALLTAIFSPILYLIHFINRPFEKKTAVEKPSFVMEEITALAGLARLSNQIGSHQERIIQGVTRLTRLTAKQIMIGVDQVAFLSTSQSVSDALVAAHIDAHTRFPVCENNDRDKIVGYINFKELIYFMRTNPNDPSVRGIVRPPSFVSPDMTAADLLNLFLQGRDHLMIVKDAAGKTLGIVTLEDVIEELVGELEDELDHLPKQFHPLTQQSWMVGGRFFMARIC